MHILDTSAEQLLQQERSFLQNLRVTLARFGATTEDQDTLAGSIRQLDELFLLVIVGEYNTGKSTFINALLGQNLLEEGRKPTTAKINILRYGETVTQTVSPDGVLLRTAPADVLRELSIVDTPGTNAIFREHEQLTSEFVPRADLVFFLISADRAFSESERAFLEPIRNWGKKVVVVLNKIDYLETEAELAEVKAFIIENAQKLLGTAPEIFGISAQKALRAKQGQPQLWPESQFAALETYIHDTLDASGRLQLKLGNPLGVGAHLVARYLHATEERNILLQSDIEIIENVERQQNTFQEDMTRAFKLHFQTIENILLEMEQRGRDYFDEIFKITKIFALLNKDEIQRGFEQRVVADVPQRIESKVTEIIDWLVESDLRQWRDISEYLAERRRHHQASLIGDSANAGFQYERERLFESMNNSARRVVDGYEKRAESLQLAENAQTAVATVALVEVGAVGLGALILALTHGTLFDLSGVLFASMMAALGLFIIPAQKRKAEQELRTKLQALRERLLVALREQFTRELERILNRITQTVTPYTRFVRSEQAKLQETEVELKKLQGEMKVLQSAVERL